LRLDEEKRKMLNYFMEYHPGDEIDMALSKILLALDCF